jgi:tetratricopeptide (TPR) repeat protein
VGKFLLLTQRQKGSMNLLLLTDLLRRFPKDQGVSKIAVEYYLGSDPLQAEKVIADYIKNFPSRRQDMLRYRIILAMRQKDPDQVSRLFRENFSPAFAVEYWQFAVNGNRLDDLRFLARDPLYKPFCEAALLLAAGQKKEALDILAKADARGNQVLLFYAARTLGENDRVKEALTLYKKFPENSGFQLNVLLNSSELYSVQGNHADALFQARKAYQLAPSLPEVQYCYADKLHKAGKISEISDVIRLTNASPFREELRKLLILSLEFRLQNSDLSRERDKILNTADRLMRLSPGSRIALEYRQKVHAMQKKE